MISVLLATLVLAGRGSEPGHKTLAALRAECIAGKIDSGAAAGLHPQVFSDDAAVEASIGALLLGAVDAGMAMPAKNQSRFYAQGSNRDH
jgi:hypothetical protein